MGDTSDEMRAQGLVYNDKGEMVRRGPGRPKGYKLSDETKAKIAAARLGKKHTPEARMKMRRASHHRWQDPLERAKQAFRARQQYMDRAASGVYDKPGDVWSELDRAKEQQLAIKVQYELDRVLYIAEQGVEPGEPEPVASLIVPESTLNEELLSMPPDMKLAALKAIRQAIEDQKAASVVQAAPAVEETEQERRVRQARRIMQKETVTTADRRLLSMLLEQGWLSEDDVRRARIIIQ